ncbi:MAG: hypothetical protein U0869_22835 [Chloroflexota bacterium]
MAILVATIIASSRLLRLLFQELDILAYAGLFIACWIGAGGALVPIPGVRPVSWFMIVQQGAALDPLVVALIAASAMALGQTSYFLVARAARRRHLAGAAAPDTPDAAAAGPTPLGLDDDEDDPPEPPPPPTSRRAKALARAQARVTRQVREHGMATVFAVCALPTPLTTLTTTAAAGSGMGYARYLPAAFAGFLVLCSVLVLFGQGLVLAVRAIVPLG